MTELISCNEAAARGITRLRKPNWKDPLDHLTIDIMDGKPGTWIHLWCPMNRSLNGRDPVDMLITDRGEYDDVEWLPYEGPLPDSDEYKNAVKQWSTR